MADHYHVGQNIRGCQPDSEPYVVETLDDAQEALADDLKRFLDDEWDVPSEHRRSVAMTINDDPDGIDGKTIILVSAWPYDQGVALFYSRCQDPSCEREVE